MTLTTILTNIRSLCDEESTTDPTDTALTAFVNKRYHDLVDRIMNINEDFFVETDQTLDTVDGTELYDLPSDFKKVKRVEISYDGTTYDEAFEIDLNDKYTTESDTDSSYSQHNPRWYFLGDQIGFDPIPDYDGTNNIKLWYIQRPTDLEGTATPVIPAEYHSLLVDGACADLKKRDDNWAMANNFEKDYESGIKEMEQSLRRRQVQSPRKIKNAGDRPYRNNENYLSPSSLS